MDSAGVPLLYPLDSNSSPWGIRCGGALLLPRAYRDIVSRIQVQVVYRQFGIWFCFLCSGYDRSRFSWVVGLVSFVFHWWWDGVFVPAATWRFGIIYRWDYR